MDVQKITLPNSVIDEEKISGFLTGIFNTDEAKKLANLSDIAFYDKGSNAYLSGAEHVNEQSIAQVRITMSDGSHKYFKRLDRLEGGLGKGLKASAWCETNEKGEILFKDDGIDLRLNFPGFTNGKGDKSNLLGLLYKESISTQAEDTIDFTHEIIKRWKNRFDNKKISHVIYGSHSMGAANALVAHVVSDLEGIPTMTMVTIEEVKARAQADHIKETLTDKTSPLFKKLMSALLQNEDRLNPKKIAELEKNITEEPEKLEESLNTGTISFHAFFHDKKGGIRPSVAMKRNAGQLFGMEVLQDVSGAIKKRDDDGNKTDVPFFVPEHRLSAMLKTASDGNYYELKDSTASAVPSEVTQLETLKRLGATAMGK